jgi:hypothetical protein
VSIKKIQTKKTINVIRYLLRKGAGSFWYKSFILFTAAKLNKKSPS